MQHMTTTCDACGSHVETRSEFPDDWLQIEVRTAIRKAQPFHICPECQTYRGSRVLELIERKLGITLNNVPGPEQAFAREQYREPPEEDPPKWGNPFPPEPDEQERLISQVRPHIEQFMLCEPKKRLGLVQTLFASPQSSYVTIFVQLGGIENTFRLVCGDDELSDEVKERFTAPGCEDPTLSDIASTFISLGSMVPYFPDALRVMAPPPVPAVLDAKDFELPVGDN